MPRESLKIVRKKLDPPQERESTMKRKKRELPQGTSVGHGERHELLKNNFQFNALHIEKNSLAH